MIHIVGRVDHAAAMGTTVWHRSSALSKLLLAAVLLASVLAARSMTLLLALHLVAWLLALASRLPRRIIVVLAAYPLLFSTLFVLAAWDGTWQTPARLLLRPMTACLTVTWLVATTPYPDLFSPLSRVLPRAAGDGLFLTYRALFELIGRSERLWRALRVRGGITGSLRRRLALAGEGLGTLVVHGLGRSERMYSAMLLRGHSGRICGCRHYAEMSAADLWVAAAMAVILSLVASLWGRP